MNIYDIEKELKKYIKESFLNGDGKKMTGDDSLFASGVIDSLGILRLVAFLEQKFKIEIEDEEMIPENFENINKMRDFIGQKVVLS